jgi:hypothetical protein
MSCPTCGLEQAPSKEIARVLADAMAALRDHDIKRAHAIVGGLERLFLAEAQRLKDKE